MPTGGTPLAAAPRSAVHTASLHGVHDHKKLRVAKLQVLCAADGGVRSVSSVYPGSVHDRTIRNRELGAVPDGTTVLADKAYAGAVEGTVLLRPVRRNEQAWKSDPTLAKAANALLSKRRGPNEHVFTQLKTWRIVHHDFPMGPRMYDITFRAIPYIHNIAREQLKST